ncbi:sugar porter family MFS transporter [Dyadobacter tibetensis]|uniref:sugar porter family MFS transporter n=1 Tax=Dyadobacter tibetensis TaxID=1211851 RepID=UPI000471AEC1|nr:sugar porter family MFS transporter [Dyadobacter tibetensis]
MKKSKVLIWSITVALGGFLFGFDTAVISGAEKAIQALWDLSPVAHGFTVSIALIGTVIGAMLGGIPTDRFGRKKVLIWIAILYLISALGSALAMDWYSFIAFRFLGGLGVGASSVAAPLYISEISPARSRGKMVGLFQFNVVFGILIAYFSNYFMQGLGDNAWRWMLGIEALPSIVFLVALLYVPESPRWLVVKKGMIDQARHILQRIDEANSEQILQDILRSSEATKAHPKARLFSEQYKTPVSLAILFAVFNQVSGINAIIYYSPRIFEMTGLGTKAAFLSSAGVGFVNFTFTLIAINFIDRFGRRTLMAIGSVGLIITLALVARAFYIGDFSGVPLFLFLYIAFFAFSQGAVIWVFISEIFPNEVRAHGQALGSFTHWIMAALIAFSFPIIAEYFGGGPTFTFFALMMVLQLIFVWRMMPETKGMSLEGVGKNIIQH